MFGTVSEEKELKVPPSEAWELYRSLSLVKLTGEKLPSIAKIDILEGDGGPETLIELFMAPGTTSYKEKVTVLDDEKRVKVSEVVEGGFLDLGFTLYRIIFEVKEKEGKEDECITKATIEYELKEEFAENAAMVSIQPVLGIVQLANDHLLKSNTE